MVRLLRTPSSAVVPTAPFSTVKTQRKNFLLSYQMNYLNTYLILN